ncbi:pisatin demethylase [Eremomyces bilateralis CBS 781.70]|uniref:Pisatin demethylase n=1 Tax=Eremomyces bilateralis CBS 781.70 TaxID=1392243 RepID=A0A6G1G555_9PEZI|nr:pisatin demethylase [Eremomyces bilateralis CBS 781.70]KAF1813184.1 pisatin demethylase [Eremomyces bilateralis CBS 781.70]
MAVKGLSLGACTILIYVTWQILYMRFFSPLRNVPGPFLAKLSGIWLLFIEMAGKRAKTVHELHRKYGPVVQLAPSEVSFITVDAIEALYGVQSLFPKAPWYKNIARAGVFNRIEHGPHRERRKLISHAFSPASVNDMAPLIRDQVQKLIRVTETHRSQGPQDFLHWFRMLSFDVSGAVFLGQSFGGLDCKKAPQFIEDLDLAFIVWDLRGRFPTLMQLISTLPSKAVRQFLTTEDRIYAHGVVAFDGYLARYGRQSDRKDLLTKIVKRSPDQKEGLTDAQVADEISNLTFAATDTSSNSLTYLFWELAKQPDLQTQMREELKDISVSAGAGVPDHRDVLNLPLLNAVINEALRKHPPVPMGLLRAVPTGGKKISGHFLPAKTVVSVPCHTTHRDPAVFPEPESFSPQRWLEHPNGTDEMRKLYMPFSKGMRNCIGQPMALLTLRLTVASLIKRYVVTLNETMKPENMEWTDHFLVIPNGGCFLDFTPVNE